VSAERKNLFVIARSRLGPEDQLTEMLAYLWQERPDLVDAWLESVGISSAGREWHVATQVTDPKAGRFDVLLEQIGDATVVVESKLGAGLGDSQLTSYIGHLAHRETPLRALVTLTRDPASWSGAVDDIARTADVRLVSARWQSFAGVIADPTEDGVAGDFVRMLIAEGLVEPAPFTRDDWGAWNSGAHVLSRLETLLGESRPLLERLSPGLKATGRYGLSTRWIYRLLSSPRVSIGVGFSANGSSRRPGSPPIIWAPVKNLELQGESAKARAEVAARDAGGRVLWGDYPYRARTVEEVLTAEDFRGQVIQTVRFAYETCRSFVEVGYFPGDLDLRAPAPD
jgi:hypothetical protein